MMKIRSINNFITVTSSGLYCAEGDFYLDPRKPVHKAVVSHAHADHAVPNSGHIYCTRPTKLLMQARYLNRLRSHFHEVSYDNAIRFNNVTVKLYSAGHMLGSSQVLMESEGLKYLYTGDFKTQQDESAGAFQPVQADVLITETTFADPAVKHPEVLSELDRVNALRQNILIGAYSMGKAQRITRLLSSYCTTKKIFIHPVISRFHKVYEEAGVNLGTWYPYKRKDFLECQNSVLIVPPTELNRFSRNNDVYRMFATGWKKSWFGCDSILQISDHADWNDLLFLIEQVKPKQVFTLHGDGTHLKMHFNDSGIEVQILDR